MSVTVDCGEGKHDLCRGQGRTAYLFPQESRADDDPPFNCGCPCHHDGRGVPCRECSASREAAPPNDAVVRPNPTMVSTGYGLGGLVLNDERLFRGVPSWRRWQWLRLRRWATRLISRT